jgi:uncharacterized protein YjbI with pentapeptide repeats
LHAGHGQATGASQARVALKSVDQGFPQSLVAVGRFNEHLSLAKLERTAIRDIVFKECKMLGLHFEHCNEFGLAFSFEDCQLDHSSFYRTKIKKTTFKNSSLKESDFSECDLTGSIFENCDLAGALFENTILEKADFRSSFNYSIDPELNRIRKAKFSISEISGLLNKYDIEIDRIV